MLTEEKAESLYARLGGQAAVDAAVDDFYWRVLDDPLLKGFFGAVDMERQLEKQKAFLAMVFGGPARYEGRDLRTAHAHLVERGLDDTHFDAVMGHLKATLEGLGVAPEAVAEVAAIAESVRGDVLGR